MFKGIDQKHHPRGLLCKLCENLQGQFLDYVRDNKEKLKDLLELGCSYKLDKQTCTYFVEAFGDSYFTLKPEFVKNNDFICSYMLNVCDRPTEAYDFVKFKEDFLKKYPEPEHNATPNKPEKEEFNILAFNDIHLQSDYVYKSNSDCHDFGGCCSPTSGKADKKENEAGYWGTVQRKCDIPTRTFEATLQYISTELDKFDFVINLGDNYSHNFYKKNPMELVGTSEYIYNKLKDSFGYSTIIPVLGNHECHPLDNIDYQNPKNFVFKNIYPLFTQFIGEDKVEHLKKRGFYSLIYKEQGVRFVILDSQINDFFNAYLIADNADPLDFFKHIGDEFYEAEQKGERVVVLSHIPFNDDFTISEFGRNFRVVLSRFKTVLSAFLSAHTHTDYLTFFTEDDSVYGMNFISPSLTTYGSYEPSFRVYKFKNGLLDDYDQYTLNLELHNKKAEQGDYSFQYSKLYSFKEAYGFDSFGTVEQFKELRYKLFNDETYTNKLETFFYPNTAYVKKAGHGVVCDTYDSIEKVSSCKGHKNFSRGSFYKDLYAYLFLDEWRSDKADFNK